MNYLTQYYKNLSEQLQEKINNLENILVEYKQKTINGVPVTPVVIQDIDRDTESFVIRPAKGKGAAREKTGTIPTTGAFPQFGASEQEQYVDTIGSQRLEPENPIRSAFGGGPPIEVDARQIKMDKPEKGHNVRGAGLKKWKKEMAQSAAETQKPSDQREEVPTTARTTRAQAIRDAEKRDIIKSVKANAIRKAQEAEAEARRKAQIHGNMDGDADFDGADAAQRIANMAKEKGWNS
jgi:hypothetical protein